MGSDNRQNAYQYLIRLSEQQGYILFDDIMSSADKWALPITDVDWLSNSITTRGILVYDSAPATGKIIDDDEDFDDYAQSDYEAVFNRVVELDPSLEIFINEIREIRPPQAREMHQLKYQVQEGNRYARERVIQMHLRFAVRIALQRAEQYDCEIADMLQDACLGLINAVDRFDPDMSGPFGSYASLWILQNVSRFQKTQRPAIYYPVHKKEGYLTLYPVLKERGCLECPDVGQCEKVWELASERLKCAKEQTEDAINQCLPLESVDELYPMFLKNIDDCEKQEDTSEESMCFSFLYEETGFSIVENTVFGQNIRECLAELKPREQQVIRARYGFDDGIAKTLEEVGTSLGVTRERVRQIENKALKKLKSRFLTKGINLEQ